MALAFTRSTFFENYNFDYDPHATLYIEFRRLAKARGWKQGSNSKVFEKAWNRCFGAAIPVGFNIDKRKPRDEGTGELLSSLRRLQDLSLERRMTKRERKAQKARSEFTYYYGDSVHIVAKWQILCQDCGIQPIPSSVSQCKKVCVPLRIEISAKYAHANGARP